MFYFNTGCNNLLVAGYGSKHEFLHKFASEHLSNYPIIVVNGFINGVTVKYILNKICDFLKQATNIKKSDMEEETKEKAGALKHSHNIEAQLAFIRNILDDEEKDFKYERVVLLVHNIDGKSLRNIEVQSVLSDLALMKRV